MEKEIERNVKKAVKRLLSCGKLYFTLSQELREFIDICTDEVILACESGPVFEPELIGIILDVYESGGY